MSVNAANYFSEQYQLWLDQAQKEYLLTEQKEFFVSIRKSKAVPKYYEEIELFLHKLTKLEITGYRQVKEEYVKVSRPSEIKISEAVLLHERPHLELLRSEVLHWQELLSEMKLGSFLEEHYLQCIKKPEMTRSCLQIFKFLQERQPENKWLLARQLPHSESTKIVGYENLLLKLFNFWQGQEGAWRDFYQYFKILKRRAEFRIYAPKCTFQGSELLDYHSILSKDWAQHYSFQNLEQTFIVENKETFHALSSKAKKSLLIFGSGWRVSQLPVLQGLLPRPIYYWGDLDKEGYEMLSFLQERLPEIKPVLMGLETLEKYRDLSVKKSEFYGPFKGLGPLQDVYEKVCKQGVMLEQEKVPLRDLDIEL